MVCTAHRPSSGLGPLVLLSIAVIVVLPIVGTASTHATVKHSEATEIIECVRQSGAYQKMVFKSRDNRFFIPCQMGNGLIGLAIFTAQGINITAFIPKDGAWSSVREYILQNATKFTGRLPF